MRLLLIIAAIAIAYVSTPAEAATKHAGKPRVVPKAQCAKTAAKRPSGARRRAALKRFCTRPGSRLVGESRTSLIGVPGSFAARAPFAVAPASAPAAPVAAEPAATPTPEAPVLPPVYSNPFAVQVRATEFALQLSKTSVSAGDVRVEFNLSRAEDPHNLWLVREDGTGSSYSFDEEPSGAVVARTLALARGRWKLLCSLTGHEAAGMRATLTVG